MRIWQVKAPIWSANAFSENPQEQKLSELQYEECKHFYMRLLPKVCALEWKTKNGLQYVFSRDTIEGGYRISVFDKKGAVSHSARDSIEELFLRESCFPYDGRWMSAVA